jgi:hypothetical protein
MFFATLLSIIIYILVIVRVKIFKKNGRHLTAFDNTEKKSMTGYMINVFAIVFISLHLALVVKINSLDLSKVRKFSNYIFVYYYHLLMPSVFNSSLTVLYYARNKSLRETVSRKMNNTYLFKYNLFYVKE